MLLDSALDLSALTRDRYASFLRGTLAALRAVRDGTRGGGLPFAATPVAARLDAYEADLAALGDTRPIRPARAIEPLDGPRGWGGAYVLEGSSLGGTVIARAVRSAIPEGPRAVAYLVPLGAPATVGWTRFVEALDAHGATLDADGVAAACHGARDVFATFVDAFRAEELVP